MNYRKRIYENYVSNIWGHTHSNLSGEYLLFAKIAKKRFSSFLPADKSARIMDVACGAGHFLYFMQHDGYKNAGGVDISDQMIGQAKKNGVVNIEQADFFEFLAKHDKDYDMIIANDIIEHLKKDEILMFLDLIYKALVPNGSVIISTLNAGSLFGAGMVAIDLTHEQGFTPESLSEVMGICGFQDVRVYGEKPIVHDVRSFVRMVLWSAVNGMLWLYASIEQGTGRGLWKLNRIFEPRIFGVGKKTNA